MKIKQTVIDKIDHRIKSKISLLTEAHPTTVEYWVRQNKHRSPLIGYNVLRLLAQEFDCQINDLVDDDRPDIYSSPLR